MEKYMCRVCLAENMRMLPLTTDLQHTYEKLTNYLFVAEGRSLLACYICYTRLQHSQRLMVTCFRSEEMLTKYINGTQQDRHLIYNQLSNCISLSATAVQHFSMSEEFDSNAHIKEEVVDLGYCVVINNTMTAVKNEAFSDEAPTQFDSEHISVHENDGAPFQEDSDDVKVEIETEDIEGAHQNNTLETHRPADTDERHECTICHKSFKREGDLNNHIQIHRDERPHKCEICQKSFKRKYYLKTHLLSHTGERAHKCTICQRSFKQKGDLNYHNLTHTGERPFECDICLRSFTLKSKLKAHLLTHADERPHRCDICHKSYSQKSHLKTHLVTHVGERPHKCGICEKTFKLKGILKRHLLTHTGESIDKCDISEKS